MAWLGWRVISEPLSAGRTAYFNERLQMVIIHDPANPWGGTVVNNGLDYFYGLGR
jgi:hypothetical protein